MSEVQKQLLEVKKLFLNILQYSEENTHVLESLLIIMLQACNVIK